MPPLTAVRVKTVRHLLAEHARALHDESNRVTRETELRHMLISVVKFCEAQEPRIDLNAALSEVRQYSAT